MDFNPSLTGADSSAAFLAAQAYLNGGPQRMVVVPPSPVGNWVYNTSNGTLNTTTVYSGWVGVASTALPVIISCLGVATAFKLSSGSSTFQNLTVLSVASSANPAFVVDTGATSAIVRNVQISNTSSSGGPCLKIGNGGGGFEDVTVVCAGIGIAAVDASGMSSGVFQNFTAGGATGTNNDPLSIGFLGPAVCDTVYFYGSTTFAQFGTGISWPGTAAGNVWFQSGPTIDGCMISALTLGKSGGSTGTFQFEQIRAAAGNFGTLATTTSGTFVVAAVGANQTIPVGNPLYPHTTPVFVTDGP